MKVTNEKIENSQAFLTIEMEPAELEESLQSAYQRLVKRANIPGFRRGRAPRVILERYMGKESLLEDALNNLVPQAYEKAIAEQAIEAIAQPQIEITQTDPVVFKAIVPLKPTIKLGNYLSIQVEPETVEITESNVSEAIEQLRHQHATFEPVERPVDFGDLVVLDIESSIEDKPFINQKGAQYQVIQDQSFPAVGFAEQLVGMTSNEEKEFKLKLPSNSPGGEPVEKEASFKARVTGIKQEILPELNDEFARGINSDFKTLDSLQEQVSSSLKLRAEEKARADFEEKVVNAVVGLSEVGFPPILVELETNRMLNQRFQNSKQGLKEYLESINQTEEELREELHPLANKRVIQSLVLGKVVEEEKIEVDNFEIDAEIENMIKSATEKKNEVEKVLNTPQVRESIKQTLITRKTLQRLTEIARGPKETSKETKKPKRKRKQKEEDK